MTIVNLGSDVVLNLYLVYSKERMQKRILVTGGNGTVGAGLVKELRTVVIGSFRVTVHTVKTKQVFLSAPMWTSRPMRGAMSASFDRLSV